MTTQKTMTAKEKKAELIKGFRNNSDIENFYRFVHENNLRVEAKVLMQTILDSISSKRKSKKNLQ
jgi:hypothetical protein